ncbi:MAG TPA: hypothetical protein VMN39_08890 [Longimicrobiaceae bacterium]|nr:hypothetical protein [Longimicrobiaceae bacterium]
MSAGGEAGKAPLPPEWADLERAVEEAAISLGRWTRRARETEEEVDRLRRSLEEMSTQTGASDLTQEVARLRAENAALKSRMSQARKRITGLMQRLAALEIEP